MSKVKPHHDSLLLKSIELVGNPIILGYENVELMPYFQIVSGDSVQIIDAKSDNQIVNINLNMIVIFNLIEG